MAQTLVRRHRQRQARRGPNAVLRHGGLLDARPTPGRHGQDPSRRPAGNGYAARQLRAGYEALREAEKRRVPRDASNALGLARTRQALRQYREAAVLYNRIRRGIDRDKEPSLYWQVQLEAARCVYEGFKDNKSVMNSLLLHLKQLAEQEKSADRAEGIMPYGGLEREFWELHQKVEAAAKSPS